jgi:hypothetical protein
VYGHDRWKAGASGCTYTFATSNNVTTIDISAGSLIQVIEGINLESGTYTLSWTGTAQGKIGAGSFGNSGITGAAVGGTNLNIEFGTGTVSLVQFELGTVVTPFERRQFGTELALCQRYYVSYGQDSADDRLANGHATATIGGIFIFQFPVKMRASPTLTFSTLKLGDGSNPATAATSATVNANSMASSVAVGVSSGLTQFRPYELRTDATTGFVAFSSEL